ncbi:hypothetical protein PENTCL1PPCAC_9715, partial [Pristionchus entomophagus]
QETSLAHFRCDECPRTYKSYDGLQKHQRIDHNRGDIYNGLDEGEDASSSSVICLLCEAHFKTDHRLSMHILAAHKDTEIRHFRCVECGLMFRTLEILRKHKKKHDRSADKPFPCDACCMRFDTWTGVLTHQKQSHGKISDQVRELKPEKEKVVDCPGCDERFPCNRTLSDHIMSTDGHEEIKHFECDICKARYRSYVTMKCHRRLTHFRRRDVGFK